MATGATGSGNKISSSRHVIYLQQLAEERVQKGVSGAAEGSLGPFLSPWHKAYNTEARPWIWQQSREESSSL